MGANFIRLKVFSLYHVLRVSEFVFGLVKWRVIEAIFDFFEEYIFKRGMQMKRISFLMI